MGAHLIWVAVHSLNDRSQRRECPRCTTSLSFSSLPACIHSLSYRGHRFSVCVCVCVCVCIHCMCES